MKTSNCLKKLSISLCYQLLDLTCSPSQISSTSSLSSQSTTNHQQPQKPQMPKHIIFMRHLPALIICIVDTLGFLGFLALLIANGIVVNNLRRVNQIYIYNSIPWVICWYVSPPLIFFVKISSTLFSFLESENSFFTINASRKDDLIRLRQHRPNIQCSGSHGYIAAEAFMTALAQSSGSDSGGGRQRDYCCAECKQESERRHERKRGQNDGATALLLRDVED